MSEAAKPADPERALALVESLLALSTQNGWPGVHVAAGDMEILLPLARAGLRAASADDLRAAFFEGWNRANSYEWLTLKRIDPTTREAALLAWLAERRGAVLRSPEPATPADGGA